MSNAFRDPPRVDRRATEQLVAELREQPEAARAGWIAQRLEATPAGPTRRPARTAC